MDHIGLFCCPLEEGLKFISYSARLKGARNKKIRVFRLTDVTRRSRKPMNPFFKFAKMHRHRHRHHHHHHHREHVNCFPFSLN